MDAAVRAGRIIAALIILKMVGSGIVNFGLEAPLFGSPGFLQNAAPHSTQVAFGALLGIGTEALWLATAVIAFPFLYERARSLTFWFCALAVVILGIAVAEAASVMSMISASEAYAKASPAGQEQLQIVRPVIAATRNWIHFLGRTADGVATLVFYTALYRAVLVPRWIAGFGIVCVVLMLAGITQPFFGNAVVFPLLAPLAISELLLAAWLLAKGFR